MKYFTIDIAYWRDEDERPMYYEISDCETWKQVKKEEWINELNSTEDKRVQIYTTDASFTLEEIEDILKTMKGIR
jgi:hypothetical protein